MYETSLLLMLDAWESSTYVSFIHIEIDHLSMRFEHEIETSTDLLRRLSNRVKHLEFN